MFDKLFEIIFRFAQFFQFFAICRQYQGGVVLRLGKFNRIAEPGFIWLWPFAIEEIIVTNVVVETMLVGPQSLTTKDDKLVVVSVVVTFSVSDPRVYLLGIEGTSRVIEDSTYGVVSENIMKRSWQELVDMNLAKEIEKDVRRMAKVYGVDVVRVRLCDFTKSRSIRLMQSVNTSYAPIKD